MKKVIVILLSCSTAMVFASQTKLEPMKKLDGMDLVLHQTLLDQKTQQRNQDLLRQTRLLPLQGNALSFNAMNSMYGLVMMNNPALNENRANFAGSVANGMKTSSPVASSDPNDDGPFHAGGAPGAGMGKVMFPTQKAAGNSSAKQGYARSTSRESLTGQVTNGAKSSSPVASSNPMDDGPFHNGGASGAGSGETFIPQQMGGQQMLGDVSCRFGSCRVMPDQDMLQRDSLMKGILTPSNPQGDDFNY